jgi:hypothetical protein
MSSYAATGSHHQCIRLLYSVDMQLRLQHVQGASLHDSRCPE